jgi:hypothetical protein
MARNQDKRWEKNILKHFNSISFLTPCKLIRKSFSFAHFAIKNKENQQVKQKHTQPRDLQNLHPKIHTFRLLCAFKSSKAAAEAILLHIHAVSVE